MGKILQKIDIICTMYFFVHFKEYFYEKNLSQICVFGPLEVEKIPQTSVMGYQKYRKTLILISKGKKHWFIIQNFRKNMKV